MITWFLIISALCTLYPALISAESRSTSAIVSFTTEDSGRPVTPVDPDRPEKICQTSDATGATGASGWLSISYVTPLNYSIEVENGIFTVPQIRPCLQTSDMRGTASGWKLTAVASSFQGPEDISPVPALLSLNNGSANNAHPYMEPPDIPDKIMLPANGRTQRLIEIARENAGVGIWVVRWYPENGKAADFQLQLFAPAPHGKLGSVLWIMNDAP